MSSLRILLVICGSIALPFGCMVSHAADSHGWAMRFKTSELAKDSGKLLPQLEEPERPARWRRQLADWRGMKEVYLQAEVQQAGDEVRNGIESLFVQREIHFRLKMTQHSAMIRRP